MLLFGVVDLGTFFFFIEGLRFLFGDVAVAQIPTNFFFSPLSFLQETKHTQEQTNEQKNENRGVHDQN